MIERWSQRDYHGETTPHLGIDEPCPAPSAADDAGGGQHRGIVEEGRRVHRPRRRRLEEERQGYHAGLEQLRQRGGRRAEPTAGIDRASPKEYSSKIWLNRRTLRL